MFRTSKTHQRNHRCRIPKQPVPKSLSQSDSTPKKSWNHFSDCDTQKNLTTRQTIIITLVVLGCLIQTIEASKTYQGVLATDISNIKKDCTTKDIGRSSGKICQIAGETWYMKSVAETSQNALRGSFNLFFVKKNIGIHVPETCYFYEKTGEGDFYFASKAIYGFISARDLMKSLGISMEFCVNDLVPPETIDKRSQLFRQKLVDKIGEIGIAQLMVARTFISDLNHDNWGVDKKGLVLIDADISPRCLTEYLDQDSPVGYLLELSINNIKAMKAIYTAMLSRPLPFFHHSVDIPFKTYIVLLTYYIDICNTALDVAKSLPDLDEAASSFEINTLWNKAFIDILGGEHNKSRFYASEWLHPTSVVEI